MKPAPRVLLLCERLDIAGGVERFVCALANHLAERGMRVSVGSVDTARAAVRYPLAPAVAVVAAGAPRVRREARGGASRRWQMLSAQWRIGRGLARLVRAEAADVVVLNGLVTACSVLPWCRAERGRVVCCDHNHFDARSGLWQRLRAWLYPGVAAVVSLTDADAPKFAAINPRTRVIWNASNLRAGQPGEATEPRVLAVGRFVAQKGLDLLLDAWARVLPAVPAARLRIVGDGPAAAALQAQADALGLGTSIEWCAPTPDIARHYREAAVFVLPSRYEGMPLVLLEAQAMGVAAAAFDCPTGPRDILGDGAGLLVPPGDVAALGDALVALLIDPTRRRALAEAGLLRSRERFTPEAHFERWTDLLREVAGA